jgi:phosphoribosylformylglycinamidine synthase
MKQVNVAVLRAAGSNCDGETAHAFEMCGARSELIHINEFLRQEKSLTDFQILVIPGGFTYGDDVSAGKILANELKYLLTEEMQKFTTAGKLILGICNGFQMLVKSGLLPEIRLPDGEMEVTLTFNDSGKFEDRWVHLKVNQASPCIFTRQMPPVVYYPVAHAEGKFIPKNNAVLERLQAKGQLVFQYCDAAGAPVQYPGNPNGSVAGIAGICDPSGRILGLMPHPERFTTATQHPHWTRLADHPDAQGNYIFQNAVNYALENLVK